MLKKKKKDYLWSCRMWPHTPEHHNYKKLSVISQQLQHPAWVSEAFVTWMLSSALWVQCIIVVKVSVVMRPPRKCWTLMLRIAIPEEAHTHKHTVKTSSKTSAASKDNETAANTSDSFSDRISEKRLFYSVVCFAPLYVEVKAKRQSSRER